MTIARIRDTMQFAESFEAIKVSARGITEHVIIRVYSTKRQGVYGYQFAAICWPNKGDGIASDKTGGCGYDKINACTAAVLQRAFPVEKIEGQSVYAYCEGWGPTRTLSDLGYTVIHAHG